MGRPKVLDDVKKREVCALVTAGMSLGKVARYVGCCRRTILNERDRDADFDQRMRRAELAAELSPMEAMRRAASTHWRAAAWILDRQERRETERRVKPDMFTREELLSLGEEVKRIVARTVFDPFEEPHLQQKIENLFVAAIPGAVGKRQGVRGRSGPTVAESIRFLEQRWKARKAKSDDASSVSASEATDESKFPTALGGVNLLRRRAALEDKKTPEKEE